MLMLPLGSGLGSGFSPFLFLVFLVLPPLFLFLSFAFSSSALERAHCSVGLTWARASLVGDIAQRSSCCIAYLANVSSNA